MNLSYHVLILQELIYFLPLTITTYKDQNIIDYPDVETVW